MVKTVNILGTEYRIEVHKRSEDEFMRKNGADGYCSAIYKMIYKAVINAWKIILNLSRITLMHFTMASIKTGTQITEPRLLRISTV